MQAIACLTSMNWLQSQMGIASVQKQTVIMEEFIASVHLYFHSIHRSQAKERRGDGHVASGEGALWDALQALHQEAGQRRFDGDT